MKKDYHFFRKLYSEILSGYSTVKLSDKTFYIKHSNDILASKADYSYEYYFQYCLDKGILPKEEKIKFLIESDLWSEQDEKKIEKLEAEIERYEVTLSKIVIKAQKNLIINKLEKSKEELEKILKDRSELLGETCESYASKKSNEALLKYIFFKDEALTVPAYTDEEFEELEYPEVNALFFLMVKSLENFTNENFKIISLMPFFLNTFFISGENPFFFYGKPTIELSSYQLDLYSIGLSVKNNLSEKNPIPLDVVKNPDRALSWFNISSSKVSKDIEGKDGASLVGASLEEMKAIDPSAEDLTSKSKRLFGDKATLNMQDMLKLHGY